MSVLAVACQVRQELMNPYRLERRGKTYLGHHRHVQVSIHIVMTTIAGSASRTVHRTI